MWLLYVPVPRGKGKAMARALLESGACRCVNVLSSDSIYRGEDGVEECREDALLVKTADAEAAKRELARIHPYELPAIITWKAEANARYEEWLKA